MASRHDPNAIPLLDPAITSEVDLDLFAASLRFLGPNEVLRFTRGVLRSRPRPHIFLISERKAASLEGGKSAGAKQNRCSDRFDLLPLEVTVCMETSSVSFRGVHNGDFDDLIGEDVRRPPRPRPVSTPGPPLGARTTHQAVHDDAHGPNIHLGRRGP